MSDLEAAVIVLEILAAVMLVFLGALVINDTINDARSGNGEN